MDGTMENKTMTLSPAVKAAYGIIAALGIAGNTLVVYVLTHKVKSRKGNINILIINQSVLDLTTSVLLVLCFLTPQPALPASPAAAWFVCAIWNSRYLFWAAITSSTFNLVCMTVERYVAITSPFRYRSCVLFKWPRSLILATIPWVVGYAYEAYVPAMHYVEDGHCLMNKFPNYAAQVIYAVIILMVTHIAPLVIMTFAYIKIYRAMRTESISIASALLAKNAPLLSSQGDQSRNQNNVANERALRNIIKTLIFIYVVFGLCWAPNEVFYFYFNISGNTHLNESVYNITISIAFVNMCINPFIYTFKYRRFREGLQQALPCLVRFIHVHTPREVNDQDAS